MTQIKMQKIALFTFISLFFLFAYKETVAYLLKDWTQWQHGAYAHGFVVLAVSIYMILGLRKDFDHILPKPNLVANILLLCLSLLWASSIFLGIRFIESLSFFLFIPTLILVLAGWPFLKKILFPIFYLLVAFPVWELFLPYLQSMAAIFSHFLLKLSGTTVLLEDTYLIVPAGKFLVAEGCSGLRYLLAAMTFGGFFIYLERLKKWRAVVYFLIVIFAAIFANALRIAAVVIAGNMTEMQHPWVHDHLTLGWYIFAAMLIPLFYVGNRLSDSQQKIKEEVVISKDNISDQSTTSYKVIIPFLILALMVGPLLNKLVISRIQPVESFDQIMISPEGKEGWIKFSDIRIDQKILHPVYIGADSIIDQNYVEGENVVRLFVAIYQYQEQGKELINVDNRLYSQELWQDISRLVINDSETKTNLIEIVLRNSIGDEKLIRYWYRTAGRVTVRPIISKLLDLYGLFTGRNDSSVIMISVDNTNGLENARSQLDNFRVKMIDQINQNIDAMNK